MHPKKLLGRYGFLQTQINSVVEYISKLDYTQLKNVSNSFFQE